MTIPSSHASRGLAIADNIAENELTGDELDQVAGGFGFLGGFGTLGVGAGVGPLSAGVGVGHSASTGDIYGTVYGGGGPSSPGGVGVFGGAQANLAFGFGNHTFDDVVTGHSTVVDFGIGTLSFNSNGFTVGLGPSGFGVSSSQTVNLSHPPVPPEVQENLDAVNGPNHSSEIPPQQQTDWSGSFSDHELAGFHGTQDTQGTTGDHGVQTTTGDQGVQGVTGNQGVQDNAPVVTDHSGDTTTDSGGLVVHDDGGTTGTGGTTGHDDAPTFGNDFGDPNPPGGGGDFAGDFGGDFGGDVG